MCINFLNSRHVTILFEREVLFNTFLIPRAFRKFIFLSSALYTVTSSYLVCPDVLSTVTEASYEIRVGFIESDIRFTIYLVSYSFIYYLSIYVFVYLSTYLFVSELQNLHLSS